VHNPSLSTLGLGEEGSSVSKKLRLNSAYWERERVGHSNKMENAGGDVLEDGEGPRKVARTDSEGGSNVWPADPSAYLLLNKVGQGAFAHVWRAELVETKTACAIKILNLEHVDTSFIDIRLEVQTMRLSSHPNVLTCHTSFVHDTNLWLVTQLMRKGSSGHCIQCARTALISASLQSMSSSRSPSPQSPLPQLDVDDISLHMANNDKLLLEDHITYILHETLLGLKYIHDNGQIHRDIKAGNILLDANGDGTSCPKI
jgi:serine/threonine-protein kinase OSR1/STK39